MERTAAAMAPVPTIPIVDDHKYICLTPKYVERPRRTLSKVIDKMMQRHVCRVVRASHIRAAESPCFAASNGRVL